MTIPTALQVYRHLPKKDCGRCGERTCMAYAMKLVSGKGEIGDCPFLTERQKKKLADFLSPAVRTVEIGTGGKAVRAGGEKVMYRHEYRFVNPTAIFVEISDSMGAQEIEKRIAFANSFEVTRLGRKLKVDGMAIGCASGNANKFRRCVESAANKSRGPLVLCSLDPKVLDAGTLPVKDERPLLYAATSENWKQVLRIAEKYNAPLAIHATDLKELGRLSKEISSKGFKDIVLDPGIAPGSGLGETISKFTQLRKEAVNGVEEYGYPLMGCTASVQAGKGGAYDESMLAGMLISRYASIVVMHAIEPWAILPVLTLRQSLYSNPAVEPSVEPKLYEVGSPDKDSPVLLTTNFALTYYSVLQDLEDANVSCHLLVVDTGGLAVTVAIAAEKLTAAAIKEALLKNSVREKVAHNRIIIPGVGGQLKDETEKATGWSVLVGPQDSSQIAGFLKEKWKGAP